MRTPTTTMKEMSNHTSILSDTVNACQGGCSDAIFLLWLFAMAVCIRHIWVKAGAKPNINDKE